MQVTGIAPSHGCLAPHLQSGFYFRQRDGAIDWRKLAAIDLERVHREMDISSLEDNLINVTYCSLSELDHRHLDPNFIKLFKLSQMIVDYLLYCQDVLINSLNNKDTEVNQIKQQLNEANQRLAAKQHELNEVKRECHKRKRLLMAQQQLMDSGPNSYHPCPYCPKKAFLNDSFLQRHLHKRHSEHFSDVKRADISASKTNPALEAEILHLREELKRLGQQLELQARKNLVEVPPSIKDAKDDLEKERQHEIEIEKIKQMFMAETKEMHEKIMNQDRIMQDLRVQLTRRPGFGELEDESQHNGQVTQAKQDEVDSERYREVYAELARQKAINKAITKRAADDERRSVQLNPNPDKKMEVSITPKPKPVVVPLPQPVSEVVQVPIIKAPVKKTSLQILRNSQEGIVLPQSNIGNSKSYEDSASESAQLARVMKTHLSLSDTGGTGEFNFDGTLSLNMFRSSRLMQQLKNDPTILLSLKNELREVLEENLIERGLRKNCTGISNSVLNDKLALLRQERTGLERKHINFQSIRAEYARIVELRAQEALVRQDGRSQQEILVVQSDRVAAKNPVVKRPLDFGNNSLPNALDQIITPSTKIVLSRPSRPSQRRSDSSLSNSGTDEHAPSKTPEYSKRVFEPSPPRGEPRPSPRKRQVRPGESTGTSNNGLNMSSEDIPDGFRLSRSTPRTPTTPGSNSLGVGERDSDWDDDDDKHFELETDPTGVDALIKQLDMDLPMRDLKHPLGGREKRIVDDDDEEHSFSSVTSMNGDISHGDGGGVVGSGNNGVNGLRLGVGVNLNLRGSALTDTGSGNTYGTSQWGTTSKVASTVNPGATGKSAATNKSSELGLDDSASDLEDL